MKAPDFYYYEAKSLLDAIKFKSQDDEAVILAGGQSLLPALNMRLSSPSCLIDISKLKDLSEIKLDDNSIYIDLYVLGDVHKLSLQFLSFFCPPSYKKTSN